MQGSWISAVSEKHRASTENKAPSVSMFIEQRGVLLLFSSLSMSIIEAVVSHAY